MEMQSTGQGGRHSPHPVQYCGATTCNCPAAPMMASTGQAATHFTQPMQFSSSISAVALTNGGAAP